MKKTFIILTSLISTTALLFGCTNPAIPSAVGERLEYSLNALANTVKNLDTVDNLYLANPDVSPVINSENKTQSLQAAPRKAQDKKPVKEMVAMVSSLNAYIEPFKLDIEPTVSEGVQTNESGIVKQNEELKYNLENNNYVLLPQYDNNLTNTTNNNHNVPSEGVQKFNYDEVNLNETSATTNIEKEKSVVQSENNNTQNNQVNEFYSNKTSFNTLNDQLNNNTLENNELVNNETQNTQTNLPLVTEDFNQQTNNLETVNKNNVKYHPRYIANNVASDNGQHLTNYITKVKNLYSMTNDAIVANNTLTDSKNNLLVCIEELKQLAVDMKNGTYEPSAQQISAINNYINDIKTTISRIRGTNGQLNNEINKINNHDKAGLTTSIDVLNSNYMRILNHIDVRITYLKNALATLEQVKNLLLEAQQLDNFEQQIALNEGNLETNYYNNVNEMNDNFENYNVNEENVINNSEQIHNEIEKQQGFTENNAQVIEPNVVLPETTLENNFEEKENYTIKPALPFTTENGEHVNSVKRDDNENNTVNKELAPIENANVDNENEISNEANEHDNVEKERGNEKNIQFNEADRLTNIDTYSRANRENSAYNLDNNRARRNTDTYNRMPRIRNIPDENINNANNVTTNETNNGLNETNLNYDNINGEVNENFNNAGINNGFNNGMNNANNNGNFNNNNNNFNNNGAYNNGVTNFRNQNDINTPNGTFQNGVITQNNLNQGTNNGVNGVRTGYNGSSNNPYIVDAKGKNRNINTYGYNTLVDIINRGTVNNGINTLNSNIKPIENVASDLDENFNVNAIISAPQGNKQVKKILAN